MWRDIPGYPRYQVSSLGRVRSYARDSINPSILKPRLNPNGYQVVCLYGSSDKPAQISVHRLVATTFMPVHGQELLYVDHLDGCKTNNRLSNLEWVDAKENSIRAFNAGLYEPIFEQTRKPVVATDLRTGEEFYFRGINEAARSLGYSPSIICRAANMLAEKVGYYVIEFAGREDRLLYQNIDL